MNNLTNMSRMSKLFTSAVVAILLSMAVSSTAHASVFANITIDGSFSDWSGVAVYDSDGDDNTAGNVDFNTLQIANNDDFVFFRVTLHESANPNTFNENYFFDTDDNTGTGFDAFAAGILGSEVLVQGATTFQEANGTFNDGPPISDSLLTQSPFGVATTAFEFRLSRTLTGSVAPFLGAQLFSGETLAVLFDTGTGTGDRIGGGLTYTLATLPPAPEPSTLGLWGVGALLLNSLRNKAKKRALLHA